MRLAYPVTLHQLDFFRPVDSIQIFYKPVPVRGDPHGPLAQLTLEHREIAPFRTSVRCYFLIGQHGPEPRTPVDRGFRNIRKPEIVKDIGPLGTGKVLPLPPRTLESRDFTAS